MLYVWFGHDYGGKVCQGATGAVCQLISPEVFKDPLVRKMLKDIDRVDTDEDGRMTHPIFGPINQSKLSNGVCGLIIAYKTDLVTDITRMGDNCIPWLINISRTKDVHCVCNRVPLLNSDFEFVDMKTGKLYNTRERFSGIACGTLIAEKEAAILAKNSKDSK